MNFPLRDWFRCHAYDNVTPRCFSNARLVGRRAVRHPTESHPRRNDVVGCALPFAQQNEYSGSPPEHCIRNDHKRVLQLIADECSKYGTIYYNEFMAVTLPLDTLNAHVYRLRFGRRTIGAARGCCLRWFFFTAPCVLDGWRDLYAAKVGPEIRMNSPAPIDAK